MALSRNVLLLVLATLNPTAAFSPSLISTRSISQQQQVKQFMPLYAEDDDSNDIEVVDPEDFIVNVGDIEEPDADDSTPAWDALNERVAAMRLKHRRSEKDTGSPEYQVAGMTERISYLTEHLKAHPKDFSTRRGLVALVNKRRRLLNYLFAEDVNRYQDVVASLGIRHKAPSRVITSEEKYGRFPGQKPNSYKNQQVNK